MKKLILAFGVFMLCTILGVGTAFSQVNLEEPPAIDSSIHIEHGFRVDNLDWNRAGTINGTSPNVLSELMWRNMEMYQLKIWGDTTINEGCYFKWSVDYSWMTHGIFYSPESQDSDYFLDNRNFEVSRFISKTDGSTAYDASVATGYKFDSDSDRFWIAPLVGYSLNKQNLTMKNGVRQIPDLPNPNFPNLNSNYRSLWKGPWFGVDLAYKEYKKLTVAGGFEYHINTYRADANWNLRTDFMHPLSFENNANGNGILAYFRGNYAISSHWSLTAEREDRKFYTRPGVTAIYLANGFIFNSRLNRVNWNSTVVSIGTRYHF